MNTDPINKFDQFAKDTVADSTATINDVKNRVTDATSKMKDKAGQITDSVSGKIDQQRENAADSLGRAAHAIHENADAVPGGPKVVKLTHSLADGMESTASYLRDRDFSQMGKDVMDVCRRYPKQTLIAAVAVGFLIGRSRR